LTERSIGEDPLLRHHPSVAKASSDAQTGDTN
jgi:hypothetical protein